LQKPFIAKRQVFDDTPVADFVAWLEQGLKQKPRGGRRQSDKKKAPVKGPISSTVVMVMMVVVMMMSAGGGRRDNSQGEQGCENIGE
jgi:hypothetical protein